VDNSYNTFTYFGFQGGKIMDRRIDKILIIIFIVFLFAITFLNTSLPNKRFSKSENRMLVEIPKSSLKNI